MPESVDFIWSCCLISSCGWVAFIKTVTKGSVVIKWRCFLWRERHFEREGWVPIFFSCACLIMHFCSRVCLSENQLFLNHTVTCKSLFCYHQSLTVCNTSFSIGSFSGTILYNKLFAHWYLNFTHWSYFCFLWPLFGVIAVSQMCKQVRTVMIKFNFVWLTVIGKTTWRVYDFDVYPGEMIHTFLALMESLTLLLAAAFK